MGTHLTAPIDHLLTSCSQQVQSESKPIKKTMADPVLPSLRGKVLAKPEKVKWRPQVDDDIRKVEYAYSYEMGTQKWTPLNSNMHMQGIKVVTHAPVPQKVIQGGGDATETTLTILEIIKEKKRKENRAKKFNSIRRRLFNRWRWS